MGNDDLHLIERHRNLWRVRVRTRELRVFETFASLHDAQFFRDQVVLDATLRKHGMPGIIRYRPTVLELIKGFLGEQAERVRAGDLADRSHSTLWETLRAPKLFILDQLRRPSLQAEEVDDRLIARFVAWRVGRLLTAKSRRPASDLMCRRDLVALSRVFRWAGVERKWAIPRRLRTRGEGKRVLPPATIFAFLEQMPLGSLERTVAEFMVATGMRPGDAFALRLNEVDLRARLIRWQVAKTSRRQTIAIGDELEAHLTAWLGNRVRQLQGLLFHLDGRPCTSQTLRRRFFKASRAVGIEPPIEYIGVARNCLIAWLEDAGTSHEAIALQVGHSGTGLIPQYRAAYTPLQQLREVAERVDALRRGGRPDDQRRD